jgi:hypothetical protein
VQSPSTTGTVVVVVDEVVVDEVVVEVDADGASTADDGADVSASGEPEQADATRAPINARTNGLRMEQQRSRRPNRC